MIRDIPGIKFIGKDETAFVQDIISRFQGVLGGITEEEFQDNLVWSLRELDPERFVHSTDDTIISRFHKISKLYLPDEVLEFLKSRTLINDDFKLTVMGMDILKKIAPFYKRTI